VEVCSQCYKRLGFGKVGKQCVVCCNAFEKIDDFAREIAKKLQDVELETFQIGSRSRGSLRALQEYLLLNGMDDRKMKQYFNIMLAEKIEKFTGTRISDHPDVVILFDLEDFSFQINIMPVYIYGRYIKRVRNISQTRWLCGYCKGRGCEICNFTGKRYFTSVEELITKPMMELFQAKNGILHGAGREDVDARMLGNGRPFVVELIEPKKRKIPIEEVKDFVNRSCKGKVSVKELRYAQAKEVKEIKAERYRKKYRAKVVFDSEIPTDKLEKAVKMLSFREIHQRTPKRVEHRRADKVRVRRTFQIKVLLHKGKIAVLEIEAEGGLYIKELISGDEGRTRPSLSELLGCDARVEKLDVIGIYLQSVRRLRPQGRR